MLKVQSFVGITEDDSPSNKYAVSTGYITHTAVVDFDLISFI